MKHTKIKTFETFVKEGYDYDEESPYDNGDMYEEAGMYLCIKNDHLELTANKDEAIRFMDEEVADGFAYDHRIPDYWTENERYYTYVKANSLDGAILKEIHDDFLVGRDEEDIE